MREKETVYILIVRCKTRGFKMSLIPNTKEVKIKVCNHNIDKPCPVKTVGDICASKFMIGGYHICTLAIMTDKKENERGKEENE